MSGLIVCSASLRLRCLRKQQSAAIRIRIKPSTPPTTPPAIAPMLFCLEWLADDVSAPPVDLVRSRVAVRVVVATYWRLKYVSRSTVAKPFSGAVSVAPPVDLIISSVSIQLTESTSLTRLR